ncbi:MAG TPA: hypothetical protein DDW54_01845 [Clostridiales bacterium]|nr:hypothetical protein [Clostridiales bacterium]
MKKYADYLFLGAAVLFSALTLLLMLAPGITATVFGTKAHWSVYELFSYGDKARAGLIIAFILALLALLAGIGLIVVKLLNVKFGYGAIVALCAAVIALVAGILFFCTKSLVGEGGNSVISTGAGAILSGIFSLLTAGALGCYGAFKLLK